MAATKIYRNYREFCKRADKRENGVSPAHAAARPGYRMDNYSNEGCWNCEGCTGCRDCAECLGIHGATGAELQGLDGPEGGTATEGEGKPAA